MSSTGCSACDYESLDSCWCDVQPVLETRYTLPEPNVLGYCFFVKGPCMVLGKGLAETQVLSDETRYFITWDTAKQPPVLEWLPMERHTTQPLTLEPGSAV